MHVDPPRSEIPQTGIHPAGEPGWNRGADEIDGPSDRVGAMCNLAGSLHHFDAVHSSYRREEIGTRSRVRCRCDWDAILEDGNPAAPLGAAAPQSDVGAQPEAILLLYVDPGDRTEGAVHIHVPMAPQCLCGQNRYGPRHAQRPSSSQGYGLNKGLRQIQNRLLHADDRTFRQLLTLQHPIRKSQAAQLPHPFLPLQEGVRQEDHTITIGDESRTVSGDQGRPGNTAPIGIHNVN